MSDVIYSLDPAKFIVSLCLVPAPITGYKDGTMIEVSRDANAFEKLVGGDGNVTRIRNRNTAGSMKLTLQAGSYSNALLTNLAKLDELSGTGITPVSFIDLSGLTGFNSSAAATFGWVKKMPDMKFDSKADPGREWIIDLASMEMFVGAN